MERAHPAAGWHTLLTQARARLLEAVRDAPHARLLWRPPSSGPGDLRWPVRDVVWHVADAEAEWQRWAEAARSGARFDGFEGHRRPAELNRLPHLLDALERTRAATLESLSPLDAAALEVRHPAPAGAGTASLGDMCATLVAHDLGHAAHIERLLAQAADAGV